MIRNECNQPEQDSVVNFFPNFFKYHYHRLLSCNAACGVKGRTLVECMQSTTNLRKTELLPDPNLIL